jgi:hypothetical protein
MRKALLWGVVCLVIGVASPLMAEVALTVYSQPAGATASWVSNGQAFTLPLTVNLLAANKKSCETLGQMNIAWPSGASVVIGNFPVCGKTGKKQSFTVARPSGLPGAELDYQYAAQLEQLALMRQRIELERQQMAANQIAAWNAANQRVLDSYQASILQIQRNASGQRVPALQLGMSCTTQVIGQFIYTNCR